MNFAGDGEALAAARHEQLDAQTDGERRPGTVDVEPFGVRPDRERAEGEKLRSWAWERGLPRAPLLPGGAVVGMV